MPAPTTQFFTGWMPFLPPNQQRQSTQGNQSTEGNNSETLLSLKASSERCGKK